MRAERYGYHEQFDVPMQNPSGTPGSENKVPISAALAFRVDHNQHGCKERETFAGGTIVLTGKAANFANQHATKTLRVELPR